MNPAEDVIRLIDKVANRANECFNNVNCNAAYFTFRIRRSKMQVMSGNVDLKVVEIVLSFDGHPFWPSIDEHLSVLFGECKTSHTCEHGIFLVFESLDSRENLSDAILEDPENAVFMLLLQDVEQTPGLPDYRMVKVPKKRHA